MAEFKGRPGSAGQRPTGGDKAVATQKKALFPAQESVPFLRREGRRHQYKDVKMLHAFVAERGRIVPRPHFRRVRAAPAAARGCHQEGAQHRAAAVRGAILKGGRKLAWKSF